MLHIKMLTEWAKAHADTERGASLVEYALLVALIAVVCIAAVTTLGNAANENFEAVGDDIAITTTA